jgi:hypothetical protein
MIRLALLTTSSVFAVFAADPVMFRGGPDHTGVYESGARTIRAEVEVQNQR